VLVATIVELNQMLLGEQAVSSGISKFRKIASYNGSPLHTQAFKFKVKAA
jgi:hypothetical protein